MPEVIIKYEKPETLKVLQALAEPLSFEIDKSVETVEHNAIITSKSNLEKSYLVNGVTIVCGDPTVDTSELSKIITDQNWDAKEIRTKAWQRKR